MTFPVTALPVIAQWYIDDQWKAIAAGDVFGEGRDQVRIRAGRTTGTRDVDPSTCKLSLRNTDGQYSPHNPIGAFHGKFGRNTPFRVGITADATWLQVAGADTSSAGATPAAGARVTTPDSAGLSITGDIDIRFDADLTTWRELMDLVGKWTATAGQKSYQLVLLASGRLGIFWSPDGTTEEGINSTIPVPVDHGRLAVRAVLDVNNGASGRTATFYTSDSISGTWVQLGDPVTEAGTTSIHNSTTEATILDTATGSQSTIIRGRVHGAQILEGIAGTVRASPDFTAQTAGDTSFADGQGNTWTLVGAVELTDLDLWFTGEVPAWPPEVDSTGADEWVPITAAGLTRRLTQGDSSVPSAYRRGVEAVTGVVAYWPCEDGEAATQFGSGLTGGKRMIWTGAPDLASSNAFACSAPLPVVGSSRWSGTVVAYTATGEIQYKCLCFVPAAGTANNGVLASFTTTGTAARWDLIYTTGGALTLSWFEADGTAISTSGPVAFDVNGRLLQVVVELTQDGADVDYRFATLEVDATAGSQSSGTATGVTCGRVTKIQPNRTGAALTDVVIGHITVQDAISGSFDTGDQLDAHNGEPAGRRIERLCQENGVYIVGTGDLDDTVAMGPQGRATLMTLLREASATDHGILHEPRDVLGLAYRTRASLEAQAATVTLAYAQLNEYKPVEDDTAIVNSATVSRGSAGISATGASAPYEEESGPLSTADPPAGVGRGYDTAATVNVSTDDVLEHHASWIVHEGTVDEPRIPGIGVLLQKPAFDAADRAEVSRVALGDMLAVTGPPTSLGAPDDVRQLVQGWEIVLTQKRWEITWRVTPASPFDILGWDVGDPWDSDGSVLDTAETTTSTSWDIDTPTGPPWTTDPAEFPFDWLVAGERVTVTAISGTSSPQTATVVRSVNGVVKAHDAGTAIALFRPFYWGLS